MSVDQIFAALASTPRRKILAYLSEATLTAGELAERFEMSKPALSSHMKILENAGLVKSEKKGQFVYYSLVQDNLVGSLHSFLAPFCPVGGPLRKEGAELGRRREDDATGAQE